MTQWGVTLRSEVTKGLLLSIEEVDRPSSNSTQKRKTAEIPHFVRNDTKKKDGLSE